jgi:competence protein ComEC
MKLPGVAIAVLFLTGIALGLQPALARHATSHGFILGGFLAAALLFCAGLILANTGRMPIAACAAAFCWLTLGLLSSFIAQQPLPENHVLSLVATKRLELSTPLRWHGHLRDEPARLPWGYGYDVELSTVEFGDNLVPAGGGLRIDYAPKPNDASLPEIHAGDEIAVLTQAKLPRMYRDDGAFDRRAYLAQQNIHLLATLRAPELLERVATARVSPATLVAKTRRRLRDEVDALFPNEPKFAGTLRAMLLGDRSFIDRSESTDFQKTGVFHVLVVAGLHVGALAFFLFWLGRRLRIARSWSMVSMLFVLFFYVAVVEQRPPVLRAALMAAIVVIGSFFYRRLDLLNSAAIAALLLLIARPLAARDTSFQLSFLAIFCIAGVALPWLDNSLQPYVRALRGWRDVSRDVGHRPRHIQFRIDLRSLCAWISSRLPSRLGRSAETLFIGSLAASFRVAELLALTFVLQIGMLPLMARDFHRIPLYGMLVNLFAVPLTTVIVPLGFLAVGAGLIFSLAGKLLAIPLSWLLWLLTHAVHWFAVIGASSYRIPGPPGWLIFAFFLAAIFLAVVFRLQSLANKWPRRLALSLLAITTTLIATFPFPPRSAAGQLELTVLDVGQGDSLFVVSPKGRTMLIDGGGAFQGFAGHEEHLGPDPGEDVVSPYLWSRGFQRLDIVALTHAHQDHLGGLAAVLQNFRVGRLWLGREVASTSLANLEQIARERHIPIEYEIRGQHFSWDGAEGSFLWPEIPPEEIAPSAKNNDSLVFRMKFGERSFMLPGDAEKQSEHQMLGENDVSDMRSDVLKVGHHGSKNSTMPEFLSAVHPSIALISAGEDNPYGHPSPELLARLQESSVRILRTDRVGALHVLTDGKRIEVSCYIPCAESETESSQTKTPNGKQESQQ